MTNSLPLAKSALTDRQEVRVTTGADSTNSEWGSSASSSDTTLPKSNLIVKEYRDIPEWDSFVAEHPKGSIFHSAAMQRCEAIAKKREPFAIGALDSNGKLCAVLATVLVSTFSLISSQMTSRSVFYAEPIYLDTEDGYLGMVQLIRRHDEFMKSRTLFAEVRPLFVSSKAETMSPLEACGYQRMGYLNYELRLDSSEAELFQRLSGKRRNNVRSTCRKGVTTIELDSPQGISILYDLLRESHSNSRIPLVHRSFLEAACRELPQGSVRILVAYHLGVPIAGGCFLSFKNRVICWYAGTKRLPGIAATSLVFWEAIKLYSSLGFEVFDLAGAGWEGEDYGPGKFKSKFGGEAIHSDRYRKIYAPIKMHLAEVLFKSFRQWISPSASTGSMNQSIRSS